MSDISLSKAVRANLLSLQNTAQMMDKTQSRLATGNKVNSALDNPSSFFTASALNSRAADMGNLLDSMASGVKVIEAANNGLTAITKNLESMQSTLRQARQDKSFNSQTFDVSADSTISVTGGRYDTGSTIKLQTQAPGVQATVQSKAPYNGTTPVAGEGVGARAVITIDSVPAGDIINIDGVDVTLTAGNAADITAKLETALGLSTAELAKKYTITNGGTGEVIIENVDPYKAAPVVKFGAGVVEATKGTTTFKFDPSAVGAVTVGGQTVDNTGSFDDFVAGLRAKAEDGNYTVTADSVTKQITLTNTAYGATSPAVSGVPAYTNKAFSTFDIGGLLADSGAANGDKFTLDGVELELTLGAGPHTRAATASAIHAAITGNAELNARYDVSVVAAAAGPPPVLDGIKITSKAAGAQAAPNLAVGDLKVANVKPQAGDTGFKSVAGAAGAKVETVKAANDEITVNYGNKQAKLELRAMVAATAGSPTLAEVDKYRADATKDINAQLKAQGLDDVEAAFDDTGRLSIRSKVGEDKILSISGAQSFDIFKGDTAATGKAEVSGYNGKTTVDKFVEEINRTHEGKLRASNDNGKLRIENLSTEKLSLSLDNDGTGPAAPTQHSIDGNSVRTSLAKQYNELRDQMDKLSSDASFNGINLLRGDKLTITFNESGTSSIGIQAKDKDGNVRAITAANLGISDLVPEELDTDEAIDAFLGKLQGALSELRSQASTFGSNLSSVENRQSFTKNMINTLETGAANLTLADSNAEAANLLALQTRQQLSSSALSMASQQDQAVLQLLR